VFLSAGRLGPVGPAGTNCVRLGQLGRCRETARGSCPVSFYGSRLGLRDGWHQCEGPSRSLRSGKSDSRAVQETSRRTPFNLAIMPDSAEFTRNLKALIESILCVGGLGFNHLGRADISPAEIKPGGSLLG
jgi:hypothetical protein